VAVVAVVAQVQLALMAPALVAQVVTDFNLVLQVLLLIMLVEVVVVVPVLVAQAAEGMVDFTIADTGFPEVLIQGVVVVEMAVELAYLEQEAQE
jgi:hypothetical protein